MYRQSLTTQEQVPIACLNRQKITNNVMSHLIPLFKINLGTYTKGKPFQIATVFMQLHLYYKQMLLLDTLNNAAKLPYELIN